MINLLLSLVIIVLSAFLYADICMYIAQEQDPNNENF
jgi:hypothetical protein